MSSPAPGPQSDGGLDGPSLDEVSLHAYFAQRLPERLHEIEEGWHQVRATAWSEEPVKTFHRLAHSLAGAGATFGFGAVSDAARALEIPLKAVVQGAAPFPDESVVEGLLDGLRRAARPPDSGPPEEPAAPAAAAEPAGAESTHLLFLVESDAELGNQLARQLDRFGYRVRLLQDPEDLAQQAGSPCAILTDLRTFTGPPAGPARLAELRQRHPGVKIAFFSSRNDLEARLEAVRAGGDAFFSKPVDIGALVERLDLLTGRGPGEPYRILILDDDPDVARLYSEVLTAAGMQAMNLGNPLEILEALASFRPDLILLDVYMPACTGPEIAAVLRQEGTVSTPIVFLSNEGRMDRQLAALSFGGDEFFTKPIAPQHLVAAVTARAHHARLLGSLIACDGLTGLLNHSTLMQRIESEFARACRGGETLSCAMLDIDRFKQINDSHGHAAGDRLLRSLALFLRQRLRRYDVIGRYGGDEIAVLLPQTDGDTAYRVLDGIRESFAQVHHQAGETAFTATLSCGIATYPATQTPESLIETADRALYAAKRAGRNRVELHSH